MDRYAGRPFLRLLECYVLDVIGQLDDGQRELLRGMEPKLAALYSVSGTWREVVAAQMDFPDTLPAQIRGIWARYLDGARSRQQAVDPNAFAATFVDQNFPAPGS